MIEQLKISRSRPCLIGVACLLLGGFCGPAQAHSLWGELVRAPRPCYQLTFSEEGGSKTAKDLLPKIAPVEVWTGAAKPLRLTTDDGALTATVPDGTSVVGAHKTWGIYSIGGSAQDAFLLRYDAKAAASETDAARSANLPVEVFVRRSGGDIVVRVDEAGKPASNAELWVRAPGAAAPITATTDSQGETRFPANQTGECFIRAMVADHVSGTDHGQHYSVIRNYSTLTFPVSADQPAAAGAQADAPKADAQAYALLQDAHDHRETFAANFPGLSAKTVFDDNGKTHAGTISSDAQDNVKVEIADLSDADASWVEDQLESLIGHRRSDSFAQTEGKDPLTFGPDDGGPLGRQVLLHDSLQSSYRVRDSQLIDVTRTMMGQKFSITVLESIKTDAGKYLPHQFLVTYFDPKTGSIDHVDAYTDTYAQIGGVWLPTSRRIITARDGGFTTRIITLSDLTVASR